ncbi:excalibur calcium-binding domain-containing protein [Massilia sp. Dwa41.01b]|uniref:excalibur calcium-binding domain-containing protein n=1 Tax=unclassified Massilia TaxID=2609279 RepID=UPI0016045869|nr:excalibur calcium-binding domain-containing protein [Massilia sp. Dwa41.01b]QNA91180.1 excalibur calcium-binding domain-containing protein [Massilia sp. Dwa41.01b]QNB01260.1 excalibur calcium-binding domain-containing protein [Massilia sp. Se16.2.3]
MGLSLPGAAFAHGGGLNAHGCHTNHKTGDYHCHRGTSRPPPIPRLYTDASRAAPQTPAPPAEPRAGRPFANCAQARAAGAAPVRFGEPGYARHLDRDHDGIGCESYRR